MMYLQNRLKKGRANLLKLKSKLAVLFLLAIVFLNTQIYATELEEAETASFSSHYSLQKFLDNASKNDGVSYIHYNLMGASNNIYNVNLITPESKRLGLREPHKFGYKFGGWYLDRYYTTKVDLLEYKSGKAYIVYAKWIRIIDNNYSVNNYKYENENDDNVILLKDCEYEFINDINIPGMPATKETDFLNQYIFSESQCPQGLCITEDYVLVTSYSEEDDSLGELMVFSRDSGEYLVTLGMDSKSHLGGIAYDGKNVWVCNSNENTLERISYDFICLMATANSKQVIDATGVVDIYEIDNKPSCITYYGGRLWVATHTLFLDSKMVAYHYNVNDDTMEKLSSYAIPGKVQGVTFDEDGKVYLSTSYGRQSSSYIKVYKSIVNLSSNPNRPDSKIEMPPGSEEIDTLNGKLYIIFESAGEKYLDGTDGKGNSISPIDKILCINTESIQ